MSTYGNLKFHDGYTHLDPSHAEHSLNVIRRFEEIRGVRLFPVGKTEPSDPFLLIMDENGTLYEMDEPSGIDSISLCVVSVTEELAILNDRDALHSVRFCAR